MSQIPIGWLMKIEGFEQTPLNNRFLFFNGISQLPAQTYFYHNDVHFSPKL